jgi:hypothetical protein
MNLATNQFLENNHTFTLEPGGEDDILSKLPITDQELLFLAWLKHNYNELHSNNKSLIMGFEGRHRSGKSIGAVTIAYMIDHTFWPRMEQRIVSTPQEFMREINIIAEQKIKGGVIIIDEGGVTLPSDAYYEEWYKTLNKVFQMFGYLNPCVFFCAVLRDNVGAKFRKLFHVIVRVKRPSNDFSHFNIYNLEYNPMFAKYMHSRPKVRIAGKTITMLKAKVGRPPQFIIDRYDNFSIYQKDNLRKEFTDKIESAGKPKKKKVDLGEITKHVFDNAQLYYGKRSKPGAPIIDATRIRYRHNLTADVARYIKEEVEQKLRGGSDETS